MILCLFQSVCVSFNLSDWWKQKNYPILRASIFFLLSILYILILSFDKCTNLVEVLPKTIGKQHHWWWLEQLHFFQWIVLWEQSSRLWVVSILYILIHLPLLSFDKCTDLMELTRSSLWLKLLHWSQWILLLSGVLSFFFSILYILIHLTLLSSVELSGSSTTADDRSCSTAHTGSSSQVPAALVDCCKLVLKGLVSEHKLKVGYEGMIIDCFARSLILSDNKLKIWYEGMIIDRLAESRICKQTESCTLIVWSMIVLKGLESADRWKAGQVGYNRGCSHLYATLS